jgi:hypothetical protein
MERLSQIVGFFERKTYKREFAIVLISILTFKIYQGHVEMVQVIIWPILSFVAIAAGLKGYENLNFGLNRTTETRSTSSSTSTQSK